MPTTSLIAFRRLFANLPRPGADVARVVAAVARAGVPGPRAA